jgi:hypothetical protein
MKAAAETAHRQSGEGTPRPVMSRPRMLAAALAGLAVVAALVLPDVGLNNPDDRRVALQGGAKMSRDGRALTVHAYAYEGCSGPFEIAAEQQADRIVLSAADQGLGRHDACAAGLQIVPLRVTLDRPLDGRPVVDATSGRTLKVYPTLRLHYVPRGYRGEADCVTEFPEPEVRRDVAGCTFRFSQDPAAPGLAVTYTADPLSPSGDIAWDPPTTTTVNGRPATLRVGRIDAKPSGEPQYERWLNWAGRGVHHTVRTTASGSPRSLLPPAELVRIGESLR